MGRLILTSVNDLNSFTSNEEILTNQIEHVKPDDKKKFIKGNSLFYERFEQWWYISMFKSQGSISNEKLRVDLNLSEIKRKISEIDDWIKQNLEKETIVLVFSHTESNNEPTPVKIESKPFWPWGKSKTQDYPLIERKQIPYISFCFLSEDDALQFKLAWG